MVNKVNLRKLIKALEAEGAAKHFDMSTWFKDKIEYADKKNMPIEQVFKSCGTAACIAGTAWVLAQPKGTTYQNASGDYKYLAADWLGLSYGDAHALFVPSTGGAYQPSELENITLEQALDTLRHLLKTGKVAWPWQR